MSRALKLGVPGRCGSLTRNEDCIPPRRGYRHSHYFTQTAFDAVPDDGIADPLARHETESGPIQSVRSNAHHQEVIGDAPSILVDLRYPGASGKPMMSLHQRPGANGGAAEQQVNYTDNRCRPLNRRRRNTARPSEVRERERKPCTRARRRFLG